MAKGRQNHAAPGGTRWTSLVDSLTRGTIRGALFAGFLLIFVLWVVSGLDLVRRVVEAEARVSEVDSRVTTADDLLSTMRSQVLLGSIYLRDALLDSPANAAYYRKQLEGTRTAVDRALELYAPGAGSAEERDAVERLRAELAAFWSARLAAVDLDLERRSAEVTRILRAGIAPTREAVMRVSDRVQELHRASIDQRRRELSETYAGIRRRIWVSTGLALVLSASIALLVTLYAGRLESRIQRQRVQEVQATRDLQRLSTKLVTAQEEERRTIARELHDEVGQALTAIKLELAAADGVLGGAGQGVPALREVRAISDRALQSVRDLSQLLHPALLDDVGLPAALERHLRSFAARTGISTELLQDRMEDRLAPEIEVCLYRIAQEALTNVARHAHASSCRVYLQRLSSTIVMTVEDDGEGFAARPTTPEAGRQGLGLLGIRERVSGVRGSYRLESAPGKGTRLTVEVPALPRPSTPDVDTEAPGVPVRADRSS